MFEFKAGMSVEEVLNMKEIDELRDEYSEDAVEFAMILCSVFAVKFNRLCSWVTFRNGTSSHPKKVEVPDGRDRYYHTVLLFGDVVLDLLNSDVLQSTKVYVQRLKEDNPTLWIDQHSTGFWVEDDKLVKITMDSLLR